MAKFRKKCYTYLIISDLYKNLSDPKCEDFSIDLTSPMGSKSSVLLQNIYKMYFMPNAGKKNKVCNKK